MLPLLSIWHQLCFEAACVHGGWACRPYGTRFDDIEIHRFKLSNPRQYTIQGLTRLHG